eukprot:6592246-Alexandrium_andersonii.AAC.1
MVEAAHASMWIGAAALFACAFSVYAPATPSMALRERGWIYACCASRFSVSGIRLEHFQRFGHRRFGYA